MKGHCISTAGEFGTEKKAHWPLKWELFEKTTSKISNSTLSNIRVFCFHLLCCLLSLQNVLAWTYLPRSGILLSLLNSTFFFFIDHFPLMQRLDMFNLHNLPTLQLWICNYRLFEGSPSNKSSYTNWAKTCSKPFSLIILPFLKKIKKILVRNNTQTCCLCEVSGLCWQPTKPVLAADQGAPSAELGSGLWATQGNCEWPNVGLSEASCEWTILSHTTMWHFRARDIHSRLSEGFAT